METTGLRIYIQWILFILNAYLHESEIIRQIIFVNVHNEKSTRLFQIRSGNINYMNRILITFRPHHLSPYLIGARFFSKCKINPQKYSSNRM